MAEKESAPGRYYGYSNPEYNGSKRFSEYITMRDGTPIAVDYYRPSKDGAVEEKPLPVVWRLTPYGRAVYEDGKLVPGKTFKEDPAGDRLETVQWDIMVDVLTSYGYVVGYADCRGMKASGGVRWAANSLDEGMDGYEINEWFAAQPFCDGNTGMFGSSYTGQTQLEVLRTCPPHLKAACVCMTDFNKYDGWVRGGIARAFGSQPDLDYRLELESAAPVDGDEDRVLIREAVKQHAYNGKQVALFQNLRNRDDWCEDSDSEYWNQVSASTYKDRINSSNAAVYLIGGWFDVFRRDTVIMYNNLTLPKKMIIGPWFHTRPKREVSLVIEHVRFYDYWLKGIDNGIMREDPIYMKCINGESGKDWSFEMCWPLPGEKPLRFYLSKEESGTIESAADGTLTQEAYQETEEQSSYEADFTVEDGVETPCPLDLEKKAMTFTSEAFDKPVHLTGHGIMSLWMAANTEDIDLFVTVTDVSEDGSIRQVTDGHLRASKRQTHVPPYNFLELPWHRGNALDERKLVSGRPYRLEIDLMPVNYMIKAGHRIRVSLTCAEKGFYFQTPKPVQAGEAARLTVFHDKIHPSYVELKTIDR